MAQLTVPVTSADHIQGGDNPVLTLVEYGDYQCPHCGAAQPVVKQILADHGERLLFAFRHFPLMEIHPMAGPAAEAAEFAGSHGLFWQMHDAIFANQQRLSVPTLIALVEGLGLSGSALRDSLAAGLFSQRVLVDFTSGVSSGVVGTPTFFINGLRFDHPLGATALLPAIDQAIHAAQVGPG